MTHLPRGDRAKNWLHRLDSYTNSEFGRPRTLLAISGECVACGGGALDPDISGLCATCAAKRRSDKTDVILFRPLRRRAPLQAD